MIEISSDSGRRRFPVRKPDVDRGIVFQDHDLFPWKTVIANVEFGVKMRRIAKAERRKLAKEILAIVGLSEFCRYYPDQLSGGMQQRVNLARVLVNRPEVLLMDEPFGALDAQTRLQMQEMLLSLWEEYRMTIVFVTHDRVSGTRYVANDAISARDDSRAHSRICDRVAGLLFPLL